VAAIGLAVVLGRRAPDERTVHDRQIDYIVGLPLLAAALAIVVFEPVRLSTLFWEWRVDLLSLPLFVGGVVSIGFGVRVLWRLRAAIAFLLFAWPVPYVQFLSRGLGWLTDGTVASVALALRVVPLATAVGSSDGSVYSIAHGPDQFVVSIGSACAGANGVIGFLVVGCAILAVANGAALRKGLWLATGLVVTWLSNVVRIVGLFAAGRVWGDGVAIDLLHPVAGVVLFDVVGVVMFLLLRRFGLTMSRLRLARPAPGGRAAVPRTRLALAIIVAAGLVVGSVNAEFRRFELTVASMGSPRVRGMAGDPAVVSGWVARHLATYDWAKRYFGASSSWERFLYSPPAAVDPGGPPVIADVVATSNLRSLSAYGIEACYRFHGYRLEGSRSVDLGGGIAGVALTYYSAKQHMRWSAVYWRWRVTTATGTRYERVVLMAATSTLPVAEGDVVGGSSSVRSVAVGLENAMRVRGSRDPSAADTERFLTEFGRQAILAQVQASGAGGAGR
jgi:exosortase/archaeosortase family protein